MMLRAARSDRPSRVISLASAAAALALIAVLGANARAADPRVVFSFDEDEGSYPDTDLVMDAEGRLYGMTVQGGDFSGGTVFRLTPTATGWAHEVLHHFTGGEDGGQPYGGVTLDAEGNVYGTCVIGGLGPPCVEEGCGVVFKLTDVGGTWEHSLVHDFDGGLDGFGPGGPVTFDNLGHLYGMTPTGGEFGLGITFELALRPNGEWVETVIHPFTGGEDGGSGSAGRLLIDEQRNIWGVTTTGGTFGAGVVFKMTPVAGGGWTYSTLYAFKGDPDGVFP